MININDYDVDLLKFGRYRKDFISTVITNKNFRFKCDQGIYLKDVNF